MHSTIDERSVHTSASTSAQVAQDASIGGASAALGVNKPAKDIPASPSSPHPSSPRPPSDTAKPPSRKELWKRLTRSLVPSRCGMCLVGCVRGGNVLCDPSQGPCGCRLAEWLGGRIPEESSAPISAESASAESAAAHAGDHAAGAALNSARPAPRLTLDRLPRGARARIREVNGVGPIRRRLLEMGVLPGTELTIERVAPLGDPLEVRLRGYRLSLRRREAAHILVDPVRASAPVSASLAK